MSELTAFAMTLDNLGTWLALIAVVCCIVPLLVGRMFSKADRTQERRETERGEL